MVPIQKSLFVPLLSLLSKASDGLRPGEAYQRLRSFFPEMKARDFRSVTGKVPENAWHLAIRWARKKASAEGLLKQSKRGIWQISKKGHDYLMQHGRTWIPRYRGAKNDRPLGVQLVLNVNYTPGTARFNEVKAALDGALRNAIANGMLCGETPAEVSTYNYDIVENLARPQPVAKYKTRH